MRIGTLDGKVGDEGKLYLRTKCRTEEAALHLARLIRHSVQSPGWRFFSYKVMPERTGKGRRVDLTLVYRPEENAIKLSANRLTSSVRRIAASMATAP